MKNRWVAVFALSSTLTAAIVSATAGAAATQLTVLGQFPGGQANQVKAMLDRYGSAHNLRINLVNASGWSDLNARAIAMSAAGEPPDVVFYDQLRMHQLVGKGVMQPLDAFVGQDGTDLGVYEPAVLQVMRDHGKLYGLPTGISLFNVYYNADRFQDEGLPAIPTEWSGRDWTWDDFTAALKKLTQDTNGDGKTDRFGTNRFGSDGIQMISLWNLHWVNQDRTRFVGTDPDLIDAANRIFSIWTELHAVGGSFTGGTAAMNVVQSYYLARLVGLSQKGKLFNWRVGALPLGSTRGNEVGVEGWGVTKGSSNPNAAWQLIHYIAYSSDGASQLNAITNRTPVRRDVARAWVSRWSQLAPHAGVVAIINGFPSAWDWWGINGAGASDVLKAEINMAKAVISGKVSPKQAIEQAAPKINAILASSAPSS